MTANDKLHLEAVQLLRDYKRVSGKAKDYNADRKAKTAKLGEILCKGCDALDRGEHIGGIATRGEWYAALATTSGYPLKRRWAEKLIERHRNPNKPKDAPSGRTVNLDKAAFVIFGGVKYPRSAVEIAVKPQPTVVTAPKPAAKKTAKVHFEGASCEVLRRLKDAATTTVEAEVTCQICKNDIEANKESERELEESRTTLVHALREDRKGTLCLWHKLGEDGLKVSGDPDEITCENCLAKLGVPSKKAETKLVTVPLTENQSKAIDWLFGGSIFGDSDALRGNYEEHRNGMDDAAFDGWLDEHYARAVAVKDHALVFDTGKALWRELVGDIVADCEDYARREDEYAEDAGQIGIAVRLEGDTDESYRKRQYKHQLEGKAKRKDCLAMKRAYNELEKKLKAILPKTEKV